MKRLKKKPCQVSHACGTCGEAQADGTTRNQPCFCRAATEEKSHAQTSSPLVSIHAGHQLALLQEHSEVFFCSQCGAVNAGGPLGLLKSQCDGTGESRRKARRKLGAECVGTGRCETQIF